VKVECFPDIKTEQLDRVIKKSDLGNPITLVIHVGINDLRGTGNLAYVKGDVYVFVNATQTNFLHPE
jgi:hypothetical protein